MDNNRYQPNDDNHWIGMAIFGKSTKKEAGNLLAYIAEQQPGITRDRLLDILILISERMATKHHLCLLAVHFNIWACGPVQEDLFIDLSSEKMVIMDEYLRKEHSSKGDIFFSKITPDINVFWGIKPQVIREVVAETSSLSDREIRLLVVGPGSFWEEEADRIHCLQDFRKGILAKTDEELDFGRMIPDQEGQDAYFYDWFINEEGVLLSDE